MQCNIIRVFALKLKDILWAKKLIKGNLDMKRCFNKLSLKNKHQIAIKIKQAIKNMKKDQDEDKNYDNWAQSRSSCLIIMS